MNRLNRILVFSVLETVVNAGALIAWLTNPSGGLFTPNKILAYAIWLVGFTVEHIIAFNVGRDAPLLRDPNED